MELGIIIDPAFLKLSLGLLLLMLSNIILGSVSAIFTQEFKIKTCFQGLLKALLIAVSFSAFYFAGVLNPDILAIDVGGERLSILSAINGVVLVGYAIYAKQVIEKISMFIKETPKPEENKSTIGFNNENEIQKKI